MGLFDTNIEFFYSAASPPCRSVMFTIKALKLDVDYKKIDIFKKAEQTQPWFIRMNPQHTVPTLNDNGFILWESRAIMGYLVTKYGRDDSLYPKDAEKRAMVDRILYFDIETLYRSIQDYFKPKILGSGILEPSKGNALKQSLEYLDEFLSADRNGGGSYVAGSQLTIADFAVLASVSHLVALGWSISSYPNVSRWFEKLKKELPFYHPCVDEGVKMLLDWISCVEEKTKKSSS